MKKIIILFVMTILTFSVFAAEGTGKFKDIQDIFFKFAPLIVMVVDWLIEKSVMKSNTIISFITDILKKLLGAK